MIPDYQSLMLPLLKNLDDGLPHTKSELTSFLGRAFGLTENELNEQLPNSKNGKRKFNNRDKSKINIFPCASLTKNCLMPSKA